MPIYTPDNFFGKVFCNGNELRGCMSVDTDKGVAECAMYPLRVKKGTDEIYTRIFRGKMTVSGKCLLTGEQI